MSTVYRPIDVLEEQVKLCRWWERSQYRGGFIHTFQGMVDKHAHMRDYDPQTGRRGKPWKVDKYLTSRLDSAETFYVRREIISRLWDFTDAYEAHEHEVILPQDLPCPRGFIYLERPLHILDARGKVTSIKAILWSEERGAVIISEFSDAYDELDEVNQKEYAQSSKEEVVNLTGGLPLLHITQWEWGTKVQNLTSRTSAAPPKRWSSMATPASCQEPGKTTTDTGRATPSPSTDSTPSCSPSGSSCRSRSPSACRLTGPCGSGSSGPTVRCQR